MIMDRLDGGVKLQSGGLLNNKSAVDNIKAVAGGSQYSGNTRNPALDGGSA